MKINLLILGVMLVALLVLPGGALGALSSVTLSYDPTAVTAGSTKTVTVTVTGSGSSATISTLNFASKNSCATVTSPGSGSYSSFVASAAGTSKTFVVTFGTTGTCTFSAQALEQSAETSTSSEEGIVSVVDPNALTATVRVDPHGNTYTAGKKFPLTVIVRNPLETDVQTTFSLDFSSTALKKTTGDSTSTAITVPAKSSIELNWTFEAQTVSGTVYDIKLLLGGETSHTSSVTVPAATSTSSAAGGGGGGGGAACNPSWSCTDWGTCVDGKQTRVCTDSNKCNVPTGKPAEERTCTITPEGEAVPTVEEGGEAVVPTEVPEERPPAPQLPVPVWFIAAIIIIVAIAALVFINIRK